MNSCMHAYVLLQTYNSYLYTIALSGLVELYQEAGAKTQGKAEWTVLYDDVNQLYHVLMAIIIGPWYTTTTVIIMHGSEQKST